MGIQSGSVCTACRTEVRGTLTTPTTYSAASTATWRDVERWESGPNDGLWNALYIAAEAYRYGATRDPEALDRLRVLLASQEKRMRITGEVRPLEKREKVYA